MQSNFFLAFTLTVLAGLSTVIGAFLIFWVKNFLCKTIFAVPFGTLVKEIDFLDLMDWAKDSKDSVYDAMRAVNKKIKHDLGIDKLLKWKVRRIFIDYKTE